MSPTYDGNGNTTSDGTYTLGYDPENRLVSASGGGNTASYAFDGRGRRKLKTVNGTTTISVTDADNREVLEYDGGTGAILRWYAYGLGPNAVLDQMNVAAGTRATLLPDVLDSIIGSMDSGTATLTAFAYKPYGSSAAPPAQFGFTGQRFDPESGFYYYRARHYSSQWGRFLQADPIGFNASAHLYAYVGNDPLNSLDSQGLWQVTIAGEFIVGGLITFGSNSGQWNFGAYGGFGFGGTLEANFANSSPQTPGLAINTRASINVGINQVLGISGSASAPLFESQTAAQPALVGVQIALGPYSVGGELPIDTHGNGKWSDVSTIGGGAGGFGGVGATYTWGASGGTTVNSAINQVPGQANLGGTPSASGASPGK